MYLREIKSKSTGEFGVPTTVRSMRVDIDFDVTTGKIVGAAIVGSMFSDMEFMATLLLPMFNKPFCSSTKSTIRPDALLTFIGETEP